MTSAPIKKSERTKSAILAAARTAFTEKGYENTTIRGIAAAAEVDPALVMRYFGSKEQLFAVAAAFKLSAGFPLNIARDDIGRTLADNYLRLWEGGEQGLPLLLRSAASSDQAAERIREIFETQTVPLIAALSGEAGVRDRAALVPLALSVTNQDGVDTTPGTAPVHLWDGAPSVLPEPDPEPASG